MRKKARIKVMLSMLKEIWDENPDFRLMQLLGNCFDTPMPPVEYYCEDIDLLLKLQSTYQKYPKEV